MATMKDVARLAGVSVATVSAAMSGTAYVSPPLRDRVNEAVISLGYRRNAVASNLKRGRTSLIGLIVPDITNPFYTEFVANVQSHARAEGLTVTLGVSDHDPACEADFMQLMASLKAEAVVVCSVGYDARWTELIHRGPDLNIVLVDSIPSGVDTDWVEINNFRTGELATDHILSFGHRRVAVVAGPPLSRTSSERVRGFMAAVARAGLRPEDCPVVHGAFQIEPAYCAVTELLREGTRPTAIFVCNNHMLIGVMRALSDLNIRVPHDISVVSVDDFPWAPAFRPALTTVRQPIAAMAKAAFDLARARIDGFVGPPRGSIFEPELMVRDSCGDAP